MQGKINVIYQFARQQLDKDNPKPKNTYHTAIVDKYLQRPNPETGKMERIFPGESFETMETINTLLQKKELSISLV